MSVTEKILDAMATLAPLAISGVTTNTGYKPLGDVIAADLPFFQIYDTDQATGTQSWGQTSTEVGFQIQLTTDRGASGKSEARDRLEYLRRLVANDPTLGGVCIRAEFEDVTVAAVPSLNRNVAQVVMRAEVWDRFETPDSVETLLPFTPPATDGSDDWNGWELGYGGTGYSSVYAENRVDLSMVSGATYAWFTITPVSGENDNLPVDLSEDVSHFLRYRVNPGLAGYFAEIFGQAGWYGYILISSQVYTLWGFAQYYQFQIKESDVSGGWHDFEFNPSDPDIDANPWAGPAIDLEEIKTVLVLIQKSTAGNLLAIPRGLTIDRLFKRTASPS